MIELVERELQSNPNSFIDLLRLQRQLAEVYRYDDREEISRISSTFLSHPSTSHPHPHIPHIKNQSLCIIRKWGKYTQGIQVLEQILEQLSLLGASKSELAGVNGDISSYYLEAGELDQSAKVRS